MPTTPHWVLANQAKIDECADGLAALGFGSMVHRPPDSASDDGRFLEFYLPPHGNSVKAAIGEVVVVVFGPPQVISQQQWEDSPLYEAP